jgi:Tol biopolymer transport system component
MSILRLSLILNFIVIFNLLEAGTKPYLKDLLDEHISVRDLSIRFDGNEAYFSSQSLYAEVSAILRISKVDGEWQSPELASFSGMYMDLEPFLAPDGLRLYFASNRPNAGSAEEKHYDIWYVERDNLDDGWSEPVNLGSPVNTSGNEFYPAVTRSGDLYFTSDGEGTKGKDDIFFSAFQGGQFTKPESLSDAVNSEGYEFNAFVDPDGSYLLYTAYARDDGLGSGDLYISRRDDNGNWSPASNLGESINSSRMDFCPFVDTKGNLYFTSKRIDFPEVPYPVTSIKDWLDLVNQQKNGQSRLYWVEDWGENARAE